jgi:hypothetical protein
VAPTHAPSDDDGLLLGSVNVPYPGELVSGDCWAVRQSARRTLALVVDGLGHGIHAAEAARAADVAFHKFAASAPGEPSIPTRMRDATVGSTRGARTMRWRRSIAIGS